MLRQLKNDSIKTTRQTRKSNVTVNNFYVIPATAEMFLKELSAEKEIDIEANAENIVTVQPKYPQKQIERIMVCRNSRFFQKRIGYY